MKINNKKGFSLIMAIMIVTMLAVMAAGFFAVTDFSTKSVNANVENLRLYWAAESASNYSVSWWVNQPDSIRKDWPNIYIAETGSKALTVINDDFGTQVAEEKFKGAIGTTEGKVFYMHASSVYEGNAGETNPELNNYNGLRLITTRYKAPRKNIPDQAVWVLDSYSYNPATGDMSNICLANVYNYKLQSSQIFENSEVINATMAGTGFHGVKGRFNEQDVRYGPCYYADLVHFDYITGSTKNGPIFYGPVRSAAWKRTTATPPTNPISWYKNEGNRFTTPTGDYYYGLGINSAKAKSETDAIENYAKTSLLGGYDKMAKPYDTENVVWSWEAVEKDGPKNGLYFLDEKIYSAGSVIKVVLETTADGTGHLTTKAKIYANGNLKETKNIGKVSGYHTGIAVREKFGKVEIMGISNENFSLITQKNQVNLIGDFYVHGAEPIKNIVMGLSSTAVANPPKTTLEAMWTMMGDSKVKGHLAVIAGLDMTPEEVDKTPPIFVPLNQRVFSTSAYISQYGELNAKGTGSTSLNLYNIGPVMTLDTQTKMTGPSDTAQKWKKVYIQDKRYLDPDTELPPFCGEDPGARPNETLQGLNPNHRWNKSTFANVRRWEEVVWRYGKPNF